MISQHQFKALFDEATNEELYEQPSVALNIQISDIVNSNPAMSEYNVGTNGL